LVIAFGTLASFERGHGVVRDMSQYEMSMLRLWMNEGIARGNTYQVVPRGNTYEGVPRGHTYEGVPKGNTYGRVSIGNTYEMPHIYCMCGICVGICGPWNMWPIYVWHFICVAY